MNRFKTIFLKVLSLQIVFLFSCAYIPKEVEKPYINLQTIDPQKAVQCKKINGRFGLMDHLPFEVKFMGHSELKDSGPLENAEEKIRTLIKESGNFAFSGEKDNSEDMIFGFTIYRNTRNFGLLWLPALTLGIIPAKVNTDYSLGVRVFKPNGELLKEYRSSVESFDYYVGLWFIPLAKSDKALNLRDIENKLLPIFFNEIMSEMKKDKIILCK